MLFKPELNGTAKAAGRSVMRAVLRRGVSLLITLLILGGLGYI
ncbi:MAG: efflux RND transporter periplasmic adaptor subunit, partial [Bradyrhizobium icense]